MFPFQPQVIFRLTERQESGLRSEVIQFRVFAVHFVLRVYV